MAEIVKYLLNFNYNLDIYLTFIIIKESLVKLCIKIKSNKFT